MANLGRYFFLLPFFINFAWAQSFVPGKTRALIQLEESSRVYYLGTYLSHDPKSSIAKVKTDIYREVQKGYLDDIIFYNPRQENEIALAGEVVLVKYPLNATFPKIFIKSQTRGWGSSPDKLKVIYQGSLREIQLGQEVEVPLSAIVKIQTINSLTAPNCQRVNILYDWKKSGITRNMPQYNQGPDGICYAYAGLQLVDMWREMRGLRISKNILLGDAVYASLVSRIYDNQPNMMSRLAAGGMHSVVEGIRKYGMCKPEVVENALQSFSRQLKVPTQDFYFITQYFMTSYKEQMEAFVKNHPILSKKVDNDPKTISVEEFHAFLEEEIKDDWKNALITSFGKSKMGAFVPKMVSDANMDIILNALAPYIESQNYVAFLKDILSQCDVSKYPQNIIRFNLPPIPKLVIESYSQLPTEKSAGQKVQTLLNHPDSSGVGISYCAKVLKGGPDFLGVDRINKKHLGSDGCGPHASIIVGKRSRGGKCQFLLRNTWGDACRKASYHANWECQRNSSGSEEGVWIDSDALSKNIYRLTYFELPPIQAKISQKIKLPIPSFIFSEEVK